MSRIEPYRPKSTRIVPKHPESSRIIPNHPESSRIVPNRLNRPNSNQSVNQSINQTISGAGALGLKFQSIRQSINRTDVFANLANISQYCVSHSVAAGIFRCFFYDGFATLLILVDLAIRSWCSGNEVPNSSAHFWMGNRQCLIRHVSEKVDNQFLKVNHIVSSGKAPDTVLAVR